MQPYLFPYLGYYQLCRSVDKFVFYDDVNYIKQGWINRNRICMDGQAWTFTIPLIAQSSFKKINATMIDTNQLWQDRLLKPIRQAYRESIYFENVFPLIEDVFCSKKDSISEMSKLSVMNVANYLDISTVFISSSSIYNNSDLKAESRVFDICRIEKATSYINVIGGTDLYSKTQFREKEIDLKFIQMRPVTYPQKSSEFLPGLSIIDVLMNNSKDTIKELLEECDFV